MTRNQGNNRLSRLLGQFIHEPIEEVTTSAGSKAGDNVIGKMLSLHVKTASGQISDLVIKALIPYVDGEDEAVPDDERLMAGLMNKFSFFDSEIVYYGKLKPGMDAEFPGCSLPSPRYLFGEDGAENGGIGATIVLEDLRPQGYRMPDKFAGLTLDEVHMVLECIARFHAASFVYLKKHPVHEVLAEPMIGHSFTRSKKINFCVAEHEKLFRQIYFGFLEFVHGTGRIADDVFNRILKLTATKSPQAIVIDASNATMESYFPVIIHGDLWGNNILFRYDESGKPVDIKFIDFQMCRMGSIFEDLYYFIYNSTTKSFRDEYLDHCLDFYHTVFTTTLQKISEKEKGILSRSQLHEGFRRHLDAAFCYTVFAIPFQIGVAPVDPGPVVGDNETTEEPTPEWKEEGISKEEELQRFASVAYSKVGEGCVAAARNSPEAIKRLEELCLEMDALHVFD